MNVFRVGAAVVCIIFLFSAVLVPFVNADWTMFRANPSNDGVGTGKPVLTPTLLWKSNFSSVPPARFVDTYGPAFPVVSTWSSPAVVDGVVYFCSGTSLRAESGYGGSAWGDVYAFNATSGAIIWDYRDNSSDGMIGPSPAVVNGVVFFGFDAGYVGALNASNGASLWNYTAAEDFLSSPTVVGGVVYIGLGLSSTSVVLDGTGIIPYNVYALNATNGDKIWNYNFTTYSYVYSSPAVVNGVVYVGSGGAGPNAGGNVYALNAADGAKLWSYTIGWTPNYSDSWVDSSPAVVGGVVYVGCDDGNVYALKASTGVKLWNFSIGAPVESSPAVVNGVVYIGSEDGNVYALNAVNGDKLWNYTTTGGIAGMGGISSSSVVVDGVVYVYQDYTGVLYALNAHNGERLWNYTIYASYSGNMASPAVVNGIVYISSEDGQVYAFGSPMPSPSPTPSDTLPIVVGGIVAVVVVAAVVFLMFQKRRKTITKNPQQ
jgi:outer membrane protein assembly factor BamB